MFSIPPLSGKHKRRGRPALTLPVDPHDRFSSRRHGCRAVTRLWMTDRRTEAFRGSITNVSAHCKPGYPPAAFRASVLGDFLADPLGNSDLLYAQRVGNHIGVIADPVDHGFCAELLQLRAGKLPALITARDLVADGAVQKSVVGAALASRTHKVGKAAMTLIEKCRTRPAEQAAYGRALLVRNPLRNPAPPNFSLPL